MQTLGIVGGGIAGGTLAAVLSKDFDTFLFEKGRFGQEQTEHSSGVNHPGLIHEPDTWKAYHCPRGNKLNWEYIKSKEGTPYEIPHRNDGELIIASTDDDVP